MQSFLIAVVRILSDDFPSAQQGTPAPPNISSGRARGTTDDQIIWSKQCFLSR